MWCCAPLRQLKKSCVVLWLLGSQKKIQGQKKSEGKDPLLRYFIACFAKSSGKLFTQDTLRSKETEMSTSVEERSHGAPVSVQNTSNIVFEAINQNAPSLPKEYLSMQIHLLTEILKKHCNSQQQAVLSASNATLIAILEELKAQTNKADKPEVTMRKRKRATATNTSHTPSPSRWKSAQHHSPDTEATLRPQSRPLKTCIHLAQAIKQLDISVVRQILSKRRGIFLREGCIAVSELLKQINQGRKEQYLLKSLEPCLNKLQEKNSIMYRDGMVHAI
jgi:hypothetical protein